MAIYVYKCVQGECDECNKEVNVSKPMMESSREEFCEVCQHEMHRVFTPSGIKTFGDGYKS